MFELLFEMDGRSAASSEPDPGEIGCTVDRNLGCAAVCALVCAVGCDMGWAAGSGLCYRFDPRASEAMLETDS